MFKKINYLFCFILFLSSMIGLVNAQTMELNLEEAKNIALKNNPNVKIAREGVKKAKSQVVEARSSFMPSVNGFTSVQHAWELPTMVLNLPPEMGGQRKFKMGTENNIVYGFNLNQPLFTGGAIVNGYKMRKSAQKIAEANLISTEQNILNSVTTVYYSVLFAQSAVRVSKEALESTNKNLEQVKKFFNAGKASRFDVLRAEVQLANIKPMLVSSQNQLKLAKSQLCTILGIEKETEFIFSDKLEFVESNLIDMPIEQLINIALKNRPEMDMLNNQGEIASRQLSLAKANYMPSLILGTSYQYQGMRDDFDFSNDDFYKSFNSSLSLSIPLFTGFKNSSKIQQAKIGIKESNHQKESFSNKIELEVKTAFYKMKEAKENVSTQEKTIEQAKEALRLADLMYFEGSSTQLDVINANFALNQAKMNYQQSLFTYNVALSNLKKSINQL